MPAADRSLDWTTLARVPRTPLSIRALGRRLRAAVRIESLILLVITAGSVSFLLIRKDPELQYVSLVLVALVQGLALPLAILLVSGQSLSDAWLADRFRRLPRAVVAVARVIWPALVLVALCWLADRFSERYFDPADPRSVHWQRVQHMVDRASSWVEQIGIPLALVWALPRAVFAACAVLEGEPVSLRELPRWLRVLWRGNWLRANALLLLIYSIVPITLFYIFGAVVIAVALPLFVLISASIWAELIAAWPGRAAADAQPESEASASTS
jgi:hypothetical protein